MRTRFSLLGGGAGRRTGRATSCTAWILLIGLLGGGPSAAQETSDLEDAFAFLEAEDIAKIPVRVATRGAAIPAGQAPAVVDLITEEEIRVSGARTLAELLSQRVGIDVAADRLVPRGINTSFTVGAPIFNHRTLLLVDGRPTNSVFFGSFLAGRELPLDHIARIEIIRGPGSALYGTNAVAGVINVVTKDAADMPRVGATAEYGSFSTRRADVFGGAGGPRWNGNFFLRYFGSAGDDDPNPNDNQQQIFGFGRATWGPFTVEGDALAYREEVPGTKNQQTPRDRLERERYSLMASVDHSFGRQFTVVGRVYGNLSEDRFTVVTEPGGFFGGGEEREERTTYEEVRIGQEASVTWEPEDWLSVTVGLEAREEFGDVERVRRPEGGPPPDRCVQRAEPGGIVSGAFDDAFGADEDVPEVEAVPGPCDFDQTVLGAFLEDQVRLWEELTVTAGVRYDRVSASGGRFSPRVNLFWQATPATSFKVGYGEAFRAPSFFELRGFQTVGEDEEVSGFPFLDPEIVRTVEGEVQHRFSRALNFRLSSYFTRGEDLIAQITEQQLIDLGICPASGGSPLGPTAGGSICPIVRDITDDVSTIFPLSDDTTFVNTDRVNLIGVEASTGGVLDLPVLGELRYGLNYTFQQTENSSLRGDPDLPLAPSNKVNFLLDYRPIRELSLFWHLRWLDRRFADAANQEILSPTFNHNVNAVYRFSPNLDVGLGIYNLFDSPDAELANSRVEDQGAFSDPPTVTVFDDVPREPRTFLASIRYRFSPAPPLPPPPPPTVAAPAELAEARAEIARAMLAGAERLDLAPYRRAVRHLARAEELWIREAPRTEVVAEAREAIAEATEARELAETRPPVAEATPRPTPKPIRTPVPDGTPRPDVTPEVKPERTPPPTPTPPLPAPTPTPRPDVASSRILLLQSDGGVGVYREAAAALLRSLPGTVELEDLKGDAEAAVGVLRRDAGRADLVIAVGSIAASVVRSVVQDRPSLFCATLSPERYGLPAPNIGGVSFEISAEDQLRTLRTALPGLARIGVIYDPEASGAFVEHARRAADSLGLQLLTVVARDPRDVGFVFRSVRGDIDLLWLIPDSTVVTRESFEVLRQQTAEAGIPFVSYAETFARKGALLALYPDAGTVGRECAALAAQVLRGELTPDRIGVRSPQRFHIAVNRRVQDLLGVEVAPGLEADVEIQ